MNELFVQIIIGKQPVSTLNQIKTSADSRLIRWVEISTSFLTAAKRKYEMGELREFYINGLLNKYNEFVEENEFFQKYIENGIVVPVEFQKINRDIVLFIDDYVEKINMVENNKSK